MTHRILVTGGNGMVGHALKSMLAIATENDDEWYFPLSKDYDLRDYSDVKRMFGALNPTVVVHLAANVGGLFKNMTSQSAMLYDNVSMNLNVVKACAEHKTRLIACLSTCVFPDKIETYPITASQLHDGPPHPSNFGYAYAKRMMDIACQSFPELDYVCIIPCNIYGEHDNFNVVTGHVIPSLIHKAHASSKAGTPLHVTGTGTPLRQFVYAKDVAAVIIGLVNSNWIAIQRRVVIAPDREYSIAEVASLIGHAYNVQCKFDNDSKKDGQYKKTCAGSADITYTPLEVGLAATIQWFNAHCDTGCVRR